MGKSNSQPSENPLEDLADELSQVLNSDVHNHAKELNATSTDQVQAGQVWMRDSAARTINAHAVHTEESAIGFTRTNTLEANNSALGMVGVKEAHIAESTNSIVLAKTVNLKNCTSVLLVAGRVEGDGKSVLTPITALAIGAGFGIAVYLLKYIFPKKGKSAA